jgi:putative NADH-flavin reductase
MQHIKKVAVIGGTGKSGHYLVQALLDQGFSFKVLLRNPEKFPIQSSLVETITGNVKNYAAVRKLLEGCGAVISTLGLGVPPSERTIFSQSTTHVIRAMQELPVRRYVVITGLNVDTPFDKKSPATQLSTDWMKTHYPESTTDKQTEYQLLTASPINWTLVRLPLIVQTSARQEIKISLADCPGEKISATDLAYFLIEQLSDETYARQAPFIAKS